MPETGELTTSHQQDSSLATDECGQLDRAFSQRAERIATLFDLDRALSAAANRYSLAAQVVHHGWPHRAD